MNNFWSPLKNYEHQVFNEQENFELGPEFFFNVPFVTFIETETQNLLQENRKWHKKVSKVTRVSVKDEKLVKNRKFSTDTIKSIKLESFNPLIDFEAKKKRLNKLNATNSRLGCNKELELQKTCNKHHLTSKETRSVKIKCEKAIIQDSTGTCLNLQPFGEDDTNINRKTPDINEDNMKIKIFDSSAESVKEMEYSNQIKGKNPTKLHSKIKICQNAKKIQKNTNPFSNAISILKHKEILSNTKKSAQNKKSDTPKTKKSKLKDFSFQSCKVLSKPLTKMDAYQSLNYFADALNLSKNAKNEMAYILQLAVQRENI